MKTFLSTLLMALVVAVPVAAQTNPAFTTTTTAAISATQTPIPLTAVTFAASVSSTLTLRAGWGIMIDGEYLIVAQGYTSGLQVPVLRGQLGTTAKAHTNGATAILGPAGVFSTTQPGARDSACPSAPAQFLVQVHVPTSDIWLCRFLGSPAVRRWSATNARVITYSSVTVR